MKRILSLTLALILCLSLLPATPVWAGDIDIGEEFSYGFDGCTLTFVGISIDEIAIKSCVANSSSVDLVIPETIFGSQITEIFASVFENCDDLITVTIPDTVTTIEESGFKNCSNLTNVTLSSNLTEIKDSVFENCVSLTGITIPDSVTTIGEAAFQNCRSLTDLTIPEGVTRIGPSAFGRCESLTRVEIPSTVTSIGIPNSFYGYDSSFSGCSSLQAFKVAADNPSYCNDYAGALYDKNKTILLQVPKAISGAYTIPSSVTVIGNDALKNCTGLTQITFAGNVPEFGLSRDWHFDDALSGVTATVQYPGYNGNWTEADLQSHGGNITWVKYDDTSGLLTCMVVFDAFTIVDCSESIVGDLIIPDTIDGNLVTCIGTSAFDGCTGLTGVAIPDSVTNIKPYAFSDCTNLSSIRFPDGYFIVGENAFYNCDSLTDIAIPYSPSTAMFANCDKLANVAFDDNIANIAAAAFAYCGSLSQITLPSQLANIENEAFAGCSNLTKIEFTGSAPQIGSNSFQEVTATAYYPAGDSTWTEAVRQNYGGNITWVPVSDAPKCLTYEITDGQVTITHCDEAAAGELVIPDTIEGYPVTAIADSAFYGCKDLLRVTLPDSISSIGAYAFYKCEGITDINIPDGVTVIKEYTFYDCDSLTTITIPDGVTSIEKYAFYICTNLTSVTIPGSVTSIKSNAFYQCSKLTELIIPEGVTSIGDFAFFRCYDLTRVTIPSSVTSIGNGAFRQSNSLCGFTVAGNNQYYSSDDQGGLYNHDQTVLILAPGAFTGTYVIPDSVTYIECSAFYQCDNLTEVIVPDGVTGIGVDAFYQCYGLTSVTIPDSVTGIEVRAFAKCTNLKEIIFIGNAPQFETDVFENVTATAYYPTDDATWTEEVRQSYGGNITWVAFEPKSRWLTYEITDGQVAITDCDESATGELIIPDTIEGYPVTKIGDDAFSSCCQLVGITIPDGVTEIGVGAFACCEHLTQVTIPDSVTSIGDYAFCDDYALSSVTISSNILSIGNEAFCTCTGLREIYFTGNLPQFGQTPFHCVAATVWYPTDNPDWTEEVRQSYGGYLEWLPEGTEELLPEVPDCLTYTIKDYQVTITDCDRDATGDIVIPRKIEGCPVVKIKDNSFIECAGITSVVIPEGVTSIERSAFYGCASLTSITIPSSVVSIGVNAFQSCYALESITLPEGLTTIEDCTVMRCRSLTELTIPDGVTQIGDEAFWECKSLTTLNIPEGVTSIGDYAFVLCESLTSLTLPDSVTSIGRLGFQECKSLTDVKLPAGLTCISDSLFIECTALESIVIPPAVTLVETSAFYNCTSLGTITFTGNAPQFEDRVFSGVTATAYYPANDPTWTEEVRQSYGGNITWVAVNDALGYLTYEIADGQVTITGCDETATGELIIPDTIEGYPVTRIGDDAFYGCQNLTHITIPNGVTGIGTYAFSYSAITTIVIPDSVTVIDQAAFKYCDDLTAVTLSSNLTSLGDYAFAFCTSLAEITIPDSLTDIGAEMLSYCNSLTRINVTENNPIYSSDDQGVLFNKDKTTLIQVPGAISGTYTIPEGVTNIKTSAFYYCCGLTEVTIPDSVTTIDKIAFTNCSNLKRINFTGSVPQIGEDAFQEITTVAYYPVEDISWTEDAQQNYGGTLSWVPDCLTYEIVDGEVIITGCDEDATGNLFIPSTIEGYPVTKIGQWAFQSSRINCVTIPDSVTTIDSCAFQGSFNTRIQVGRGVTSIGSSAFSHCLDLRSLCFYGDAPSFSDEVFFGYGMDVVVFYPAGNTTWTEEVCQDYGADEYGSISWVASVSDEHGVLYNQQKTRLNWAPPSISGEYTIPNGVERIARDAFQFCYRLTGVTIPDTVTIIDVFAFNSCVSLTEVTIPDSVTTVDEFAFSNCPSVTSVTLSNSLTTIASHTFAYCTGLTDITIPKSVTDIWEYSFDSCTNLKEIYFAGSAPEPCVSRYGPPIFASITGTAYYPSGDPSWTEEVMNEYCGNITWEPWYSAQPELKPAYPNVSFEDEVVMKVYFSAQNIQDVVQMGLITYDQEVPDWNVDNAQYVIPGYTWNEDAQLYYAQTLGIPAAQMNKPMYFAVYAQLTDGSYAYSRLVSYCPSDYAYNLLEDETMGSMAVSLLNYGAAAQAYFGTDGDGLMNSSLTEEQLALAENYRSDMVAPVTKVSETQQGSFVSTGGFTNRYPTVSFEGVFSIDYFAIPAAAPVDGMTMYVWDQKTVNSGAQLTAENAVDALAMTNDGTGTWQASVGDIAACQLDDGVYVAFCYSDGATEYCSGVLGYSIGNYCASQANGDTALATLAKATAVYGYYAKQLFA